MVFGRRKRERDEAPEEQAEQPAAAAEAAPATAGERTTSGPWDAADVPDDDRARVDLGGLRVPVPDGLELRVDVNPEGNVVAAVAVDRGSQMQLSAFAAPRLEGIWDEVRIEIAQSLRGQGGEAEEVPGPFGRELRARIPGEQRGTSLPARFLGADGPRWFLRGLVTGPAATDPAQAERLHEVFRDTVVVRGKEAMAPRDPIPLHLPREAVDAARAAAEAAGDDGGEVRFDPFDRGPEITETR